jgi:DNA-binding response OmpR family regulator
MSKAIAVIVEDDPSTLKLQQVLLEQLGLDCRTFRDIDTGFDAVAKMRPAVVCTDLMLPRSSGWELCRRIRADQQLAGTPIIVVTARNFGDDRARALELAIDGYVTKPFRREEFTEAVRAALGRK